MNEEKLLARMNRLMELHTAAHADGWRASSMGGSVDNADGTIVVESGTAAEVAFIVGVAMELPTLMREVVELRNSLGPALSVAIRMAIRGMPREEAHAWLVDWAAQCGDDNAWDKNDPDVDLDQFATDILDALPKPEEKKSEERCDE